MSSATIHLVVPTLAVMATGLFPRRTVAMWAFFTVVPDLDFVFNFFGTYVLNSDLLLHRAIFHNIFIGLPTLIAAVWLWQRMLRDEPHLTAAPWRTRWDRFGHVRGGYALVLITFFLESHVLLDMFQGGVTPFWPFVNAYVYPRWFIWVNTETGAPRGEATVETGTGAPALTPEFPWMTPEHFAIWFIVIAAALVGWWAESRMARTPPAPPRPFATSAGAAPETADTNETPLADPPQADAGKARRKTQDTGKTRTTTRKKQPASKKATKRTTATKRPGTRRDR